jgi:molybdopterin converting factor small subunit|tara:strand:+ start:194 stop:457 length:264 start_codon:yes stop_codon:yes gene_type:complete
MATLFLPRAIASLVDGIDQVEIDAPRVVELLQELVRRYPAVEDRLGEMAVAVDGDIYHDADYVPLQPNSDVHLVPRIAGGSPEETWA